jgi:hypothetical protein
VIVAMNKQSLLLLLAFALLTGGLVGCGENGVPENPSWARDIQPLMEAHCIRCHGGGGTLNGDPDVPPLFKKPYCPPVTDGGTYTCAPLLGNFTTQSGLMPYVGQGAKQMQTYLDYPMPPPPSEALDGFETDLLLKWAARPLP